MADKTILAVGGRKMSVARPVKRIVQVAMALAITSCVALFAIAIASIYAPRGGAATGFWQWYQLIQRPDIQATAIITAIVSILFVYWQRDREKR
ncbi:MAG: hypothetical protein RL291_784 [Pseudomonadota bacterium]